MTSTRRSDPARTSLVLLAALVALLATIAVLSDRTHGITWDDSWLDERLILPVATVAAAALGLYPARGSWFSLRRRVSVVVAIMWAATGAGALPNAMTRSCCSLGVDIDVARAAVAPLGIGSIGWVFIAVLGGPLLLLLAASPLPDQLNARWGTGRKTGVISPTTHNPSR